MKRFLLFLLILTFLFGSCKTTFLKEEKHAEEVLNEILMEFSIDDGIVYSDERDAKYPLTDEMLERLFWGTDLGDLRYVSSVAVYFSRRFYEDEIFVFELFDISHQKAVMKLLSRRAEKKENAVLFANGVYIYLICTEKNEEIKSFLL